VPALMREQPQACLVKNAAVKRYRAQQLAKALAFLQGRGLAVMLLKGGRVGCAGLYPTLVYHVG
jgi:hypothetical protein